ncbi:hypothetical protein B0H13DRAFT_1872202 [Mycena leptocephala]|nr:hypothetical protein B0H13DRAFT_1872202 [Mycena leptocephala]
MQLVGTALETREHIQDFRNSPREKQNLHLDMDDPHPLPQSDPNEGELRLPTHSRIQPPASEGSGANIGGFHAPTPQDGFTIPAPTHVRSTYISNIQTSPIGGFYLSPGSCLYTTKADTGAITDGLLRLQHKRPFRRINGTGKLLATLCDNGRYMLCFDVEMSSVRLCKWIQMSLSSTERLARGRAAREKVRLDGGNRQNTCSNAMCHCYKK